MKQIPTFFTPEQNLKNNTLINSSYFLQISNIFIAKIFKPK